MRRRRLGFFTLVIVALSWTTPRALAENDYGGGPDENADRATPQAAPADTRPLTTFAATETAAADATNARVVGVPIEDFAYDELVLKGTAKEVCAGRLLTGSGWVFNELVSMFGGTAGTMYYCRERWDAANDPVCNGQLASPITTPNFYSTCWSNHARGRAIDIMVGALSGGGYNRTRGLNIVNWLLAPDGNGNVNAKARSMGIQQILFDDRCWNSDGDRGIASWNAMRECGVGHHDHVHLDLTLRGANGTVGYWGATPVIAPKWDTQVLWDQNASYRQAVSWWNMRSSDEEGLALPAGYDEAIVGDWDSDGVRDEIMLWDRNTGNYILQNWTAGDSLNARIGRWSTVYDTIIPGDWDSDGEFDDMILWDRDTGNYVLQSWSGYDPIYRGRGTWSRVYDQLYNGDFDGDGHVDDSIMWDNDSGNYVVHSWQGFQWTYRSRGTWSRVYDRIIVGDFSSGGEFDEMILWDRESGLNTLHTWAGFRPQYVRTSNWGSVGIDIAVPGDYDTDGRVDDLFLYDVPSGRFYVWSYHRNLPSVRTTGTWLGGYDVISVGSFMD